MIDRLGLAGGREELAPLHEARETEPGVENPDLGNVENTGNKRGHGSAGSTGLKMGQSC